ncbi:uncharacterized protein LOC128201951 [Galleria mellonella]|uniref:Uncharacterized protein LOC128201951 n=1 Tax=Galleria mellonella TaxID=7137 RepID=A0ABM3MYJ5_GALME|nr:uncharacterized protein LOC128201951 [Galleria mellonella]
MHPSIVFLFATAVVFVNGQGIPIKTCPPGEHSVLYCPRVEEPSCVNSDVNNLPTTLGACDIPDCFCDVPTVRNLKTGKCIPVSEC